MKRTAFDCIARGVTVAVFGALFSWLLGMSLAFIIEDANHQIASFDTGVPGQGQYLIIPTVGTVLSIVIGVAVAMYQLDNRNKS